MNAEILTTASPGILSLPPKGTYFSVGLGRENLDRLCKAELSTNLSVG